MRSENHTPRPSALNNVFLPVGSRDGVYVSEQYMMSCLQVSAWNGTETGNTLPPP